MADGGVMPQALPHRREVAVFFKLLLDLLATVARMEVFFDSFCARVAMMVSRSSPSSSFMVHIPSSVKYTSMPILFNNLACWRVSTVFLANLDTSPRDDYVKMSVLRVLHHPP